MRTYSERDDRFAHMQNVFMPTDRDKPNLPFSEFIVEHGQHQIVRGSMNYEHHYYAKYCIPRGSGAMVVSVISGSMFYCEPDAPYEVSVNMDEPHGRLTDEDLMLLLAKIVAGGTPYVEEEGDTDGI
jgi:hypothetical protein